MKTFRLPGLIDIHVHLRDPGQTYKEDFYTGTLAALAGGYTTVFDMPNNTVPVTTAKRLQHKIDLAKNKTVCNIGFHFGSLGNNLAEFNKVANKAYGLKLYLNMTTGGYLLDPDNLVKIYQAWPKTKPILLHAEEDIIETAIEVVRRTGQPTHVCHISSEAELAAIMVAKREGLPLTCGVTPHHLFLTEKDELRLGAYGKMKPSLKSQADQQYLWDNFKHIDVIESDHAPHTKKEKESDEPFGVPGLETTLPLLLQAEREGKLSRQQIIEKCVTNPAKIVGLKLLKTTYIDVEPIEYQVSNQELKTKCGWSPFAGRVVFGKVRLVVISGKKVYENGELLIEPGAGKVIAP